MNFKFSEAESKILDIAAKFAEEEVEPLAKELDRESRFPDETFNKMVEVGFTGIGTPVEYGGSGGDDITKIIVVSEIAKKCICSKVSKTFTQFSTKLLILTYPIRLPFLILEADHYLDYSPFCPLPKPHLLILFLPSCFM